MESQTLNVSKENAVKAHKEATRKGKALLENLFGSKTFVLNIMERINSYADVYEEAGVNPADYETDSTDWEVIVMYEFRKLRLLYKVLSEGKRGTYMHYPVFNYDGTSAGFRFWVSIDTGTRTRSVLGPLLTLPTGELAKHAGTKFLDSHKIVTLTEEQYKAI